MNLRRTKLSDKPDINITPVLDMVFILLIFFAVTTTFMVTRALEIDLQETTSGAKNEKDVYITVAVDRNNAISVDGSVINQVNLNSEIKIIASGKPGAAIIIEADKLASYGVILNVVDAGKLAGIDIFAMQTQEIKD